MASVPEIDLATLESQLVGGAVLIDVREDDEYAEGHVSGAIPIPLATVPDRVGDVPSEGTVYVICALGGRSARAVEYLIGQGVDAVNVAGGTQGWTDSGRPVVRGSSPV